MAKPQPQMKRIEREQLPDNMKRGWDQATELTGDATFVEVSGNNPAVYEWYYKDF